LITFDNYVEAINRSLKRDYFLLTVMLIRRFYNSRTQGVSGKMNNLPNYHGEGSPEARGLMQLHRLPRLKVDPG